MTAMKRRDLLLGVAGGVDMAFAAGMLLIVGWTPSAWVLLIGFLVAAMNWLRAVRLAGGFSLERFRGEVKRQVEREKERITEVQEEARRKMARDLHDGPTQSLAAIAMRLNYARRLLERDEPTALDELQKVEDLARSTTKELRHMLFTIRPLILESQGLVPALFQLAAKIKDTNSKLS